MVKELAAYTEEEFIKAFSDMTVADFAVSMEENCGISIERHTRKVDTLKAAHAAVVAAAESAPVENPAPPAGPAPAPVSGAGVQVYLVRSRQPQGRWRAGRHWGAFEEVREDALRPEEWAELRGDKVIEIRPIRVD